MIKIMSCNCTHHSSTYRFRENECFPVKLLHQNQVNLPNQIKGQ